MVNDVSLDELVSQVEVLENKVDELESSVDSSSMELKDFASFLKAFCLSHRGPITCEDLYDFLLKEKWV